MTTTIKEKIDTIIDSRKNRVAETETVLRRIRAMTSIIEEIQRFGSEKIRSKTELVNQFENISPDIAKLLQELAGIKAEFEQLKTRFNRATLNIGIVGNARQGKSTLLQTLTGLSETEIPTGDIGHCTGAPSMIYNSMTFHAKIEFYTKDEFLEKVVIPCFKELSDDFDISPFPPHSIEDFRHLNMPEIPVFKKGITDSSRKPYYIRLRDRQLCLAQYENLLDSRTLDDIDVTKRNNIRMYVAQETSDKPPLPLSQWNAVKMATIYCPFPLTEDIGNIAVCDTPGLGDFVIGAEESLIKMIGNNIDVVIMLKMISDHPGSHILKDEDTKLYNLVPQAIQGLDTKDWCYFFINKAVTDDSYIDHFKEELTKFRIETRNSPYVANCRDKNEVLPIYEQLIEDIANNLSRIDDILFQKLCVKEQQVANAVKDFANKASTLFPAQDFNSADIEIAGLLFSERKGIWKNLGNRLAHLVSTMRKKRDEEFDEFVNNLEETEKKLQTIPGLPTLDEVKENDEVQGLEKFHANKLQEIRSKIIRTFADMEIGLKKQFDNLREEVKKCFTDEDGGKLKNVPYPEENQEWLKALAEDVSKLGRYEETKRRAKIIANVITQFSVETLSFRGFILPKIFKHLDALVFGKTAHSPYQLKMSEVSEEETQKNVITALNKAADHAVSEACAAVKPFAKEPSEALYAFIEELRDAIIYTEGEENAKEVWKLYYIDHRNDVWQEQFQARNIDVRLYKEWQQIVEKLKNICFDN
ncbi:MAG: hypothetical protein LBI18_12390 [Planctomycetaceae bacterium]|jgi:hypothetical protein|nr:hypothetical protein [Planctomycetaceae bacterium]